MMTHGIDLAVSLTKGASEDRTSCASRPATRLRRYSRCYRLDLMVFLSPSSRRLASSTWATISSSLSTSSRIADYGERGVNPSR
jgi:hypothetical protein